VQNGGYLEYIPQLDEVTTAPIEIEDGMALAPREPGLGVAWDWDAVEARSVAGFTAEFTANRQ
jgi:L-alanine-DL-glutamate epimerase-like enolase superfamily enzyme